MHGVSYHRPVRTYPEPLPNADITIAPPPMVQGNSGRLSWLTYLLPVIGSFGSVAFVFVYHNRMMTFIMGGIALLSVLSGLMMWFQQSWTIRRTRKSNWDKYTSYLREQDEYLTEIAQRQIESSHYFHPSPSTVAELAATRCRIWERRREDEDFLSVSVGRGRVPFCCHVRVNVDTNPLIEYEPELMKQAQSLAERFQAIEGLPVVVRLTNVTTMSVTGPSAKARDFVRTLLCQVAVFHAPNDVQFMAYVPDSATAGWSWFKWLPHARRLRSPRQKDGSHAMSMMADNPEDFQRLFHLLVQPRIQQARRMAEADARGSSGGVPMPHLILVIDGYEPERFSFMAAELEELWTHAEQAQITVICMVEDNRAEPPMLKARVRVDERGKVSYEETTYGGRRDDEIQMDVVDLKTSEQIARNLAPLRLSDPTHTRDLSETVRLADLFGFPSVAKVDVEKLWSVRSEDDWLRIPIGERVNGKPLLLDIKEAAAGGMGPHGLIVGATGSGKSELMRTIVTGLAITHAPDLLNFVFVDFKGGAAFADFTDLPHCAGSITNIEQDLTLVDRMKAALYGELERRQSLLREAGNLDNLRQYHAMRLSHPEMEPLPYLLVIVDEFGELLANRPDFLDLFIAIGRIGRSIGIHLLLATQRLDEGRIRGLEGHLRYRICLRTFTPEESSAMLGTQDAYYLPPYPGVGYFKVDTSTYDLFKTALVSSRYSDSPQEEIAATAVRVITATGRYLDVGSISDGQGEDSAGHASSAIHMTDMDILIEHCRRAGESKRSSVHKVWLPPLSGTIDLSEVIAECGCGEWSGSSWKANPSFGCLRVPVGRLDMPAKQEQVPMFLDFSGIRGHLAVVGASQTGKSTFLRTLVTSFALTHSPLQAQFYVIDLGGGSLRTLVDCPHVGAVCGKSERERILRLIQQVRTVIEEREYLFREAGIEGMESFRRLRAQGRFMDFPYGDVFLLIDDIAQLQAEFDLVESALTDIVSNGLNFGVHAVITANRWADIRPKIRDNIGGRIEFRLNEVADSIISKSAQLSLPEGTAGRALTQEGLQFQVAISNSLDSEPQGDEVDTDRLSTLFGRMRAAWGGPTVPPLRMLPGKITKRQVQDIRLGSGDGVALGIEDSRLQPVYIDILTGDPHFLIFGDSGSGKSNLLRTWIHGLYAGYSPQEVQVVVVDYRRTLLDTVDGPNLYGYACTPAMVQECVGRLCRELEARIPKSAGMSLEELRRPWTWDGPHYVVMVDDYDWVVTPMGNPLAPLTDYLLPGRDIGFHLVIARRVGGASRSAFEPVLQRLHEMGTPGLILSGDPQEGPLIGNQRASALPPGRGYWVRRNHKTVQMQIFLAESNE
jgi:S-DNA-T family DNA segregation ATPase FtsK/SpoIIIE